MCSEKQESKLFSFSMGSVHGCNPQRSNPSAGKNSTKLTLFEDVLEKSENSNSGTNVEDQHQGDFCPSDCESGVSGAENVQQLRCSNSGLIRVCDGEMIHEIIKKKLVSSLSLCGFDVRVEAIHRNDYSSIMNRAKLQSFCLYSKAVEMKRGGNANVKYAWYGASKNEINGILSHGFGLTMSNRTHGRGVSLSPVEHPIESLQLAAPDEDGRRHMLLCRVILGKMENICPGSEQYNPSSENFDSAVDNLASPQKYIIWSSRMNTHLLPEFVVSFRASSFCRGHRRNLRPSRLPNSDWIPFPTLITTLSKFLPPEAIESITKYHNDYRKQKATRHEMIQQVRHIAGDKLLMAIIKSCRGKSKQSGSSGSSSLQQSNRRS